MIHFNSLPLWVPGSGYVPSALQYYCEIDFAKSSLMVTLPCIIYASLCVDVLVYCYYAIYKEFKKREPQLRISTLWSRSTSTNSNQITLDKIELQILKTTVTLAGWTFSGILVSIYVLGWTPLIACNIYQAITGLKVNLDLWLVFASIICYCICGDSMILLLFDRRWNSAAKDLLGKLKGTTPFQK